MRGIPEVRTDAGGRFKLSGLIEGDYSVRASRDAGFARWLVEPVSAKTGDLEVRIELAKQGGIKGKLAYANGDAPGAFSVSLGGWGGGSPFAAKDGAFELPE